MDDTVTVKRSDLMDVLTLATTAMITLTVALGPESVENIYTDGGLDLNTLTSCLAPLQDALGLAPADPKDVERLHDVLLHGGTLA